MYVKFYDIFVENRIDQDQPTTDPMHEKILRIVGNSATKVFEKSDGTGLPVVFIKHAHGGKTLAPLFQQNNPLLSAHIAHQEEVFSLLLRLLQESGPENVRFIFETQADTYQEHMQDPVFCRSLQISRDFEKKWLRPFDRAMTLGRAMQDIRYMHQLMSLLGPNFRMISHCHSNGHGQIILPGRDKPSAKHHLHQRDVLETLRQKQCSGTLTDEEIMVAILPLRTAACEDWILRHQWAMGQTDPSCLSVVVYGGAHFRNDSEDAKENTLYFEDQLSGRNAMVLEPETYGTYCRTLGPKSKMFDVQTSTMEQIRYFLTKSKNTV